MHCAAGLDAAVAFTPRHGALGSIDAVEAGRTLAWDTKRERRLGAGIATMSRLVASMRGGG